MKANKFFAVAMAALAMVACKPSGDEPTGDKLDLSKTSLSLMVGEEQTVEATVVALPDTAKEKIGSISAPPTKASGVPCKPAGRSAISLLILSRTSVILS